MSLAVKLLTSSLLALLCNINTVNGVFLTPTAYTLTGVMGVNGSDDTGGCPTSPSSCVGASSTVTTCDCGRYSTLGVEPVTGVLIDDVIPTIDITERNTAVWAAPLFTVRGSTDTALLGFRFSASVVLHEVELYLFHCPSWGIGAESIVIHNGASFPLFSPVFSSIGSVTLHQSSCESLTRVTIPLQMARSTHSYFIELVNPSGDPMEWVHIAEVRFIDHQATMATATSTTGEPITTTVVDTTALDEDLSTINTDETTVGETSTQFTSLSASEAPSNPTSLSTTSQPQTTLTTSITTHPTMSLAPSTTTTTIIIILVVVIVVLLFLLATGGVLFLVCVLRVRSSRRGEREETDREYDTIQEMEVIVTKTNDAYGQVGGSERNTEMVRNEAYDLPKRSPVQDVEYEEVH